MKGIYVPFWLSTYATTTVDAPHRALHLQPPRPDHLSADTPTARTKRRSVLGGLIDEYEPAA
ncbi:MAG: hypothetical protein WA731_12260 [Pseudonocardiaceae bacterium]